MILVTAATGKLGHHVIKHLLHRVPASEIVAGVRNRQKAKEFSDKGIELRELAGRQPRHYTSIDECVARMQEANPQLSPERARHLTIHGVNQNEDGTYSWKFDNYVRAWPPYDMRGQDIQLLWSRITCPTLLLYGKESRAGNPVEDGRAAHFRHAQAMGIDGAGHWVQQERPAEVNAALIAFLK